MAQEQPPRADWSFRVLRHRGGRSGHPASGAALGTPGTAIARAGHAETARAASGQHCDAPEWSGDDIELWGAGDPEGLANAAGSVQYAYEAAAKPDNTRRRTRWAQLR